MLISIFLKTFLYYCIIYTIIISIIIVIIVSFYSKFQTRIKGNVQIKKEYNNEDIGYYVWKCYQYRNATGTFHFRSYSPDNKVLPFYLPFLVSIGKKIYNKKSFYIAICNFQDKKKAKTFFVDKGPNVLYNGYFRKIIRNKFIDNPSGHLTFMTEKEIRSIKRLWLIDVYGYGNSIKS